MRICFLAILLVIAGSSEWTKAGDPAVWSEPASVKLGDQTCVTYRATRQGNQLLISAKHGKSWHTYALDNDIRVEEKLAGRASLGTESPTMIEISGAQSVGRWRQSVPIDLSQPELRWYRWGFEHQAMFAIQLDPSSIDGAFTVRIRGQACDQQRCQRVDVQLTVSESMLSTDVRLNELHPVKTDQHSQTLSHGTDDH